MTDQPSPPPPDARRGFLTSLAAVLTGAVVTLTPLFAGVMFALDPIRRSRQKFRGADRDGFLFVTRLNELPEDGSPARFTITADLIDAWNLFKNRTIGTVYLRLIAGATNPVVAFTDVCPHLGCKITYQSSVKHFYCPCHASTFDLDGTKINKIPPRNMDSLDVKVVDGGVWVKYQDFRGATAEKIPT
jgi:Rieske Fe-S protein